MCVSNERIMLIVLLVMMFSPIIIFGWFLETMTIKIIELVSLKKRE